jgi:hypothetical protein
MKWFSVEISKVPIKKLFLQPPNSDLPIVYSLYDIRTGDIFFKLEVDVINNNYTHQSLEDYVSISEGLKELALTMKEDQPYSYSIYITPLFRDNKINEILTK